MRRPISLVWSQEFPRRQEALAPELKIKKWSRAKKEALIAGDLNALSEAAKRLTGLDIESADNVASTAEPSIRPLAGGLLGPNGREYASR